MTFSASRSSETATETDYSGTDVEFTDLDEHPRFRVDRIMEMRAPVATTADVPEFRDADHRLLNFFEMGRGLSRKFTVPYAQGSASIREPIEFVPTVHRRLADTIVRATLSDKWLKEGIAPPNVKSKAVALMTVIFLYEKFHLLPQRIAASVEEGITLVYQHYLFPRTMTVESYNDGQIAAVVNEAKNVLFCGTIEKTDFREAFSYFNA